MAWHTFIAERQGAATLVRYHDMADAEHRERHKALHGCFEELFADYILNHPKEAFGNLTVPELLGWSKRQTYKPDKPQDNPRTGTEN